MLEFDVVLWVLMIGHMFLNIVVMSTWTDLNHTFFLFSYQDELTKS
jgi:hypothetical protein